ncbi:VOC family protein [Vibrio vulnificus]|uniref:VOC family protein n=1 Tax=Vibrio TaxID=662 RepID=UPI0006A60922|nr:MULTISPECIES: VOC family protein [Vibrio]EJG0767749.1 VOC family protein [Vibrio parahaemolyticus O5:K30]EGQ8136976.1 glyoxalase [Vibrio parahaemolyticus]EGQ8148790.1 glyoxalase [Vibrio parahaemolyticus]EGQ8250635.1 glyoxalase [Vibrio parahaemolyticus]EGQ8265116.1 glyoxalase [Vibrio parahaemolyticus]
MENLNTVEIKPFVPSKDFECSKRFYQIIGFEMVSEFEGIAYFKYGSCSFLLQDFYEPVHSNNFMMHLLVEDARSWYKHVLKLNLNKEFGVKVTELIEQPWGMLEFCVTDPSGVLWRIAENQ